VYDGNDGIWLIPFSAEAVIRLDIKSGEMTAFDEWPDTVTAETSGKFIGGVWYNGSLYMAPYSAASVISLDPATGKMTAYNNWPDNFHANTVKFIGGVLEGTNFWMIPCNTNMVVKMNLSSGSMTGYGGFPGGVGEIGAYDAEKFAGGVLDSSGGLWLVPNAANQLVRVDIATGAMTGYKEFPSQIPGAQRNKFFGGAFDGKHIWLAPSSAKALVRVDPSNGNMTGYENFPRGVSATAMAKSAGAVFDGENLWIAPYSMGSLLRANTSLPISISATVSERVYAPAAVSIRVDSDNLINLEYFSLKTNDHTAVNSNNFSSWYGITANANKGTTSGRTISAGQNGIYWIRSTLSDGSSTVNSIKIDNIYTPCLSVSGKSGDTVLYSESLAIPHGLPLESDGSLVANPSLGYQEVTVAARHFADYDIVGESVKNIILNNPLYKEGQYSNIQFAYTKIEEAPPVVKEEPPVVNPLPVTPEPLIPVEPPTEESEEPEQEEEAPEEPAEEEQPPAEVEPPPIDYPEDAIIEVGVQEKPPVESINTDTGKRMVTYALTTITHKKDMTAYAYRIVAVPSAELLFHDGSIPAFAAGDGIIYSLLYKNRESGIFEVLAADINASQPFVFDNPGEMPISEIVLHFEQVPSGFAAGSEILYTYEVLADGYSHGYYTSRNIEEFKISPSTLRLEEQIAELEYLLSIATDPQQLQLLKDALTHALALMNDSSATEEQKAIAVSAIDEVLSRFADLYGDANGDANEKKMNLGKVLPILLGSLLLCSMLLIYLLHLRKQKQIKMKK